jgi:chorismate synthase
MSHNTFGHLFRVTTWGESHGPAIGCVVDGCPPLLPLTEADIQPYLDRRRPGQSSFTTQRQEPDEVQILSGVFEGRTTGTPIALQIQNVDQRSKDYGNIARSYRSSARETAMRVAAGAIARRVLGDRIVIRGAMIRMGAHGIDPTRWDWDEVTRNPFFCPDVLTAEAWATELSEIRKQGSSIGAVLEIRAEGVPAGFGAPLYGKLDADLAAALMSINAVKGVEIGDGFAAAALRGEANADEIRAGEHGEPNFLSNHAGGILGGISTGQTIIARFAVKPTSSILTPRRTIDETGAETEIFTRGRHDPCVGIRAVPVGEAMMACVLADHLLRHRAQMGDASGL